MQFLSFTRIYLINAYKVETERPKQVDIVLFTLHGYIFSEKYRILKRMFFFLYFCYISLFCKVCRWPCVEAFMPLEPGTFVMYVTCMILVPCV